MVSMQKVFVLPIYVAHVFEHLPCKLRKHGHFAQYMMLAQRLGYGTCQGKAYDEE